MSEQDSKQLQYYQEDFLTEWNKGELGTMAQFHNAVAV